MNLSTLKTTALSETPQDPWLHLRRFTAARIALGRTGGSQPTRALLDFRHSHALARDAVQAEFLPTPLAQTLASCRIPCDTSLRTLATDRRTFLLRPDLAKSLDEPSISKAQHLASRLPMPPDLVILISDGLSALAANRHAADLTIALVEALSEQGWIIAPVVIVPFARVKLQDQVGSLLVLACLSCCSASVPDLACTTASVPILPTTQARKKRMPTAIAFRTSVRRGWPQCSPPRNSSGF